MEMNLQAGKDINIEGVEFLSVIDQSVKGIQESVLETIQSTTGIQEQKSKTDQLIDGFMSGSTFTKIVYIVVVGGIITAIIAGMIKIFAKSDPEPSYMYT